MTPPSPSDCPLRLPSSCPLPSHAENVMLPVSARNGDAMESELQTGKPQPNKAETGNHQKMDDSTPYGSTRSMIRRWAHTGFTQVFHVPSWFGSPSPSPSAPAPALVPEGRKGTPPTIVMTV